MRRQPPQIYLLHSFSPVLGGVIGVCDAIYSKIAFSFYISLYKRVRGVRREKHDLQEPDSSFLPINSPSSAGVTKSLMRRTSFLWEERG